MTDDVLRAGAATCAAPATGRLGGNRTRRAPRHNSGPVRRRPRQSAHDEQETPWMPRNGYCFAAATRQDHVLCCRPRAIVRRAARVLNHYGRRAVNLSPASHDDLAAAPLIDITHD